MCINRHDMISFSARQNCNTVLNRRGQAEEIDDGLLATVEVFPCLPDCLAS